MLRAIAIGLNVLLILLGVLSLVRPNCYSLAATLIAGILNLFILIPDEVPDGLKIPTIACNVLAVIAGVLGILISALWVFSEPNFRPESNYVIAISFVTGLVLINCGLVSIYYVNELDRNRRF
ncbi:MAG: hypothetical protein AAFX76_10960 [Planctomycetota bacterium]